MAGRQWSSRDAGEDYADWGGDAWADEHVAIRHPTLTEAVGLDGHRWRIVGIDLGITAGGDAEIILTAHDRKDLPASHTPVEFRITGISVGQFIEQVFTEFHVALTARDETGAELPVTERRELPFPSAR